MQERHFVAEEVKTGKNEWEKTEGFYEFSSKEEATEFIEKRNNEYSKKKYNVRYRYAGCRRK